MIDTTFILCDSSAVELTSIGCAHRCGMRGDSVPVGSANAACRRTRPRSPRRRDVAATSRLLRPHHRRRAHARNDGRIDTRQPLDRKMKAVDHGGEAGSAVAARGFGEYAEVAADVKFVRWRRSARRARQQARRSGSLPRENGGQVRIDRITMVGRFRATYATPSVNRAARFAGAGGLTPTRRVGILFEGPDCALGRS